MPDEQLFVPRVRALGEWEGIAIDGDARVRLHQRGIILAWHDGRAEWRVPFGELAGLGLSDDALVLYSPRGRVVLTSTYELRGLLSAMLERACALPELARGARTVGSRRGGDPATQARFFAPLLDARRRAEIQSSAEGKVRALDGTTIAAQVAQLLGELASAQWPSDLPEQRALGAELEECCEDMFAACDALDASARAWLDARDVEHLKAWREWVGAAARLFAASDRAWGQVAIALSGVSRTP